jgi:TolB-like protein/Flp pilus assembly protein TadD
VTTAPSAAQAAPTATGLSRRSLLLGAGLAAGAAIAAVLWSRGERASPRSLPSSIAVLPFKPLLPQARNEAIEVGMAELLINRLSPLPGVVVKPLSSVRRYSAIDQDPAQAGRELDVEAVVDGTVQIAGNEVRLTARLLDVATGQSLWAGNFTQQLGDFFAMQDALVTQLVSALAVHAPLQGLPSMAGGTADTEAWQLYANGRYQLERRDRYGVARAKAFFRDAIARDRGFALAITGLSEACALSGVFGMVPPIPAFEEARTAARRALELQPNLPSALTAMGHVFTQRDRNWSGGRDLYERALRLAPATAWSHAWLALNLVQSGSAAAAIEQIARARQIEPAVAPFMALSGLILYHARDFAAARRQLQDILEAAPDAVLPRHFLARVLLAENDAPGAIRLLEGRNDQAPGSYSTLGRAYAMVGNRDGARAEIARVEVEGRNGFGVGYDLALLHLALGDHERAFAGLERGIDDCSQMLGYINVDPALDPIRNEPRVRAVARRIGLA